MYSAFIVAGKKLKYPAGMAEELGADTSERDLRVAKRLRLRWLAGALFCACLMPPAAYGQVDDATIRLPNSPEGAHQQSTAPAVTGQSGTEKLDLKEGSASLAGVVVDATGAAVPGARIVLTHSRSGEGHVTSAGHGEFDFLELPPGAFRLTITAVGFEPLVSAELRLTASEALVLPPFVLAVSTASTSVEVFASVQEVAQVQVKEAEKQRAFGVLPNFYSSYIWDAAPLNAKQKFDLATHSVFDPVQFISAGIIAGVEQANNTFPEYGKEAGGYGKRFGATYADQFVARVVGSALLPSVFHQDPRYFYKGSGTVRSRLLYAVSSAVVCRGDSGHLQPNFSYIVGAFAAGGVSYAYHSGSDRSGTLILRNGFIAVGGHALNDVIREFLLRRVTPKVPDFEKGKPAAEIKR